MENPKQNLTLVIGDRNTSLDKLKSDFLATVVKGSGRKRLTAAFDNGLIEIGDRQWTRDDLYER